MLLVNVVFAELFSTRHSRRFMAELFSTRHSRRFMAELLSKNINQVIKQQEHHQYHKKHQSDKVHHAFFIRGHRFVCNGLPE